MAVSKRLRYEVLRRDNHACRYCGAAAPDVKLTVDHVTPTTLGGTDTPDNLVAACRDCNSGKSSVPPDATLVADVEADAIRWARAVALANQWRSQDRYAVQETIEAFDERWMAWRTPEGDTVPKAPDWKASIETFMQHGLEDEDELIRLLDVAMRSKAALDRKWNYFCGCAWTWLRERDKLARHLIDEGWVK